MPLQFKVNIIEELKKKGYSTYALRQQGALSESTIQKLRTGKGLSWDNLEKLCKLLACDIGDILEYIPEGEEAGK